MALALVHPTLQERIKKKKTHSRKTISNYLRVHEQIKDNKGTEQRKRNCLKLLHTDFIKLQQARPTNGTLPEEGWISI